MTPGVLLLIAACGVIAGLVLGPWRPRLWLALTSAGAIVALVAALWVLVGATDWEWRSGFAVAGEPLHLRLDGLSAFFLVLLSVVGGAGAVYAREYWADQQHPDSAGRGRLAWNAISLSMGGVLLISNGLHFLIAWELFAISGYFLIVLERQRREVRTAGWLYLAVSHAGTLCLFAFFVALAARTGSWELGPLRAHAELAPLFWLALAGFGVKAGLFPLHIWLPSAHANAPSHVSAIMSGVAIKMGLYGIIRFGGWLPVPPAAGGVVIGIGAVTALLGIAFAFAQNDLKRLLAYCSVENVGIIAIGLGGALLGVRHGDAPWGRLLLAGALLHVWNHGAFKALLFLGAGSVLHATGTRELSRLGGLARVMPWTAGLFALGAAAISALPPLNGFVSEWLLYLGLFDAAASRSHTAWAAMPAVIALATAGALALASFVKASAMIFLGAPRTEAAAHAHECGPWMRGPMLALAGACVGIGLAPCVFWPAVARAVGAWNPAWAGAEMPAPLFTLSAVQFALAGLFIAGGTWLWRRARANGLRRALTWDCGYARPTARMQYTGGSFAGIAGGWFAWILQPERALRRPRGPFPGRASRIERVPETVLERGIEPAGRVVMRASAAVRRLQHGRLQFYILYLAAGVAVLAMLVWLEGRP
ncbi:MAG TPA: proton-conducting transporter membrane subunit [Verrucomicrobiae bacterium]|nr:proton-conducting transporter membrane subunit [Verrucomicrobiae bacterium]